MFCTHKLSAMKQKTMITNCSCCDHGEDKTSIKAIDGIGQNLIMKFILDLSFLIMIPTSNCNLTKLEKRINKACTMRRNVKKYLLQAMIKLQKFYACVCFLIE